MFRESAPIAAARGARNEEIVRVFGIAVILPSAAARPYALS